MYSPAVEKIQAQAEYERAMMLKSFFTKLFARKTARKHVAAAQA